MTLLLGESFRFNKTQFLGDILGVLTAIWYGCYIVSISQLRKKYNSTSVMFISGIITAFFILLIASLIFEEHLIPQAMISILALFLLGFICHFLGQSFITHSLAFLPASSSSLTLLIQPIAATILGYLFFQETLNFIQFLGSILILIGIYLAQRTNEK